MTGLPIDFQIQQQSHANAENDGPRSALGLHSYFRWQARFSGHGTPRHSCGLRGFDEMRGDVCEACRAVPPVSEGPADAR
jgi:hypothetical protein